MGKGECFEENEGIIVSVFAFVFVLVFTFVFVVMFVFVIVCWIVTECRKGKRLGGVVR